MVLDKGELTCGVALSSGLLSVCVLKVLISLLLALLYLDIRTKGLAEAFS